MAQKSNASPVILAPVVALVAALAVALAGCPPPPPPPVNPGTGPAAGASVCRGADAYVSVSLGIPATRAVAADFDGDGLDDLAWVVGGVLVDPAQLGMQFALSRGDGTFADAAQIDPNSFNSLQAIDVDKDGRPDLVATSTNSTAGTGGVFIYRWQPATRDFSPDQFHGPSTIPGFNIQTDINVSLAADLDGDGNIEMMLSQVGIGGRPPVILRGDGPGTFSDDAYIDTPAITASGQIDSFATVDLNGDGLLDLVMSHQDDLSAFGASIGVQNSDGTFAPSVFADVGGGDISARVFDFSEDGLPDLLWGGALYLGLGGTDFAAPIFPIGGEIGLVVRDLDGDGFVDVVGAASDPSGGMQAVLIDYGTGPATFAVTADVLQIPQSFGAAVGNFDGQRGIDIVVDGGYASGAQDASPATGLAVLFSRCSAP